MECLHKSATMKDQPNVRGEEDVMIASTNGLVMTNAAVPVVEDGKGGDVSVARANADTKGGAVPGIGNVIPHHCIDQKRAKDVINNGNGKQALLKFLANKKQKKQKTEVDATTMCMITITTASVRTTI
jgi:hypothetical protein